MHTVTQLMPLLDYSHKKALISALVVVVLALLFPSLFGLMFPSSAEVSFDAGTNYSTCSNFYFDEGVDRSRCTTQFLLVVGNTGTIAQDLITIEFNYVPDTQRLNWTTLDIVASSVRSPAPVINEQLQGAGRVVTVAGLAPNRLIEFSFTARGPESRALLDTIEVSVQADGRVIHASPHLTVVSRFVKNMFGIFGF